MIVHSIADAPSRRIAWSLQRRSDQKKKIKEIRDKVLEKSRLASVLNWFESGTPTVSADLREKQLLLAFQVKLSSADANVH